MEAPVSVPQWLEPLRAHYVGSEVIGGRKVQVLDASGAGSTLSLGAVRAGSHVVIRNAGVNARMVIRAESWGSGATVRAEDVGVYGLALPEGPSEVAFALATPRGVTIDLPASAQTVVLDPGSYTLNAPGGGGLYRAVLRATGPKDDFTLGGNAVPSSIEYTSPDGIAGTIRVTGTVRDFRSIVPCAELSLEGVVDGLTVSGATRLRVGEGVMGAVAIDVESLEVGQLQAARGILGTGSIHASDLTCYGPFGGTDVELVAEVENGMRVIAGGVKNASIVVSGAGGLMVGSSTIDDPLKFVEPKVESTGVTTWGEVRRSPSNRAPAGTGMEHSSVDSLGPVQVFGDVIDCDISSTQLVLILGTVRARREELETAAAMLGTDATPKALKARTVALEGDLDGDAFLTVTAEAFVCARAVSETKIVLADTAKLLSRSLVSVDITGGSVYVEKDFAGTTALVNVEDVSVGGEVADSCDIRFSGRGTFKGAVKGPLGWSPQDGAELSFDEPVSELVVKPTGSGLAPRIRLARNATILNLVHSGKLSLFSEDGASFDHRNPQSLTTHVSAQNLSTLRVEGDHVLLGVVDLPLYYRLEVVAKTAQVAVGSSEITRPRLALHARGRLHLTTDRSFEGSSGADELALSVERGALRVARDITELVSTSKGDAPVPTLEVPGDFVVSGVSGRFVLGPVNGKILVRPRGEVVVAGLTNEVLGPDQFSGGVITGANVVLLDHITLKHMAGLRVLELHTRSLAAFARRPHNDQQRRAQNLRDLSDIATERSSSGASRAVARWAATHAAAKALRPTQVLERFGRFLHRQLGYGQHPLAPTLWLAAWMASLATLLYFFDSAAWCESPATTKEVEAQDSGSSASSESCEYEPGPYGRRMQVYRVLLIPFQLFRYDAGGAPLYAPIGNSAILHAGAFAITSVLLLATVIAVRNYMKTPHRRLQEDDK